MCSGGGMVALVGERKRDMGVWELRKQGCATEDTSKPRGLSYARARRVREHV